MAAAKNKHLGYFTAGVTDRRARTGISYNCGWL